MRQIELTRNKMAIVDDEDFEWLSKCNWHCSSGGYAVRASSRKDGPRKKIYMHVEIATRMGICGDVIDHEDLNTLHNWRTNLRPATYLQSVANRRRFRTNKSGFKGVCLTPSRKGVKWQAYIMLGGKSTHLGFFANPEAAAKAYDQEAFRLFGEFACLNFPIAKHK